MDGGPGRDAVLIQYEHQVASAGVGPHPIAHSVRNERWRLTLFRGLEALPEVFAQPRAVRKAYLAALALQMSRVLKIQYL